MAGRLCYLILVMTFTFGFLSVLGNALNCTHPKDWDGYWWTHSDDNSNSLLKFTSDTIARYNLPLTAVHNDLVDEKTCTGLNESTRYHYLTLSASDDTTKCVKLYVDDNVMVFKETSDIADQCSELQYPSEADIYAKIAIERSGAITSMAAPCPIDYGRYEAVVTLPDETQACQGDRNSYISVRDSEILIETCLSGNSYESPLRTTLTCVGEIPADALVDNGLGNILLLSSLDPDYFVKYYTARHSFSSEGSLVLSLQGSYTGKINPHPEDSFKTAGRTEERFYYGFVLEFSRCDTLPCENGGTCTDLPTGYVDFVCTCLDFITGRFCEKISPDSPVYPANVLAAQIGAGSGDSTVAIVVPIVVILIIVATVVGVLVYLQRTKEGGVSGMISNLRSRKVQMSGDAESATAGDKAQVIKDDEHLPGVTD